MLQDTIVLTCTVRIRPEDQDGIVIIVSGSLTPVLETSNLASSVNLR